MSRKPIPRDGIYIVAGSRPWNRAIFEERIRRLPGRWHYVDTPEALTVEAVERIDPRMVFFVHWSHTVPAEIWGRWTCINFHMTDLPYGRGGSPLQNLVLRGHRHTRLSAHAMTDRLDAGPVYLKEDLCLQGSAEEIYLRMTETAATMIERILRERPDPVPQEDGGGIFRRRRPEQSEVPALGSLDALHDFIRMLDAEGYPRAFLVHEGFRYELSRAARRNGRIVADVTITRVEERS